MVQPWLNHGFLPPSFTRKAIVRLEVALSTARSSVGSPKARTPRHAVAKSPYGTIAMGKTIGKPRKTMGKP